MISKWFDLMSLIFPEKRECLACGQKSRKGPLCDRCLKNLNLMNKQEFCRKCGKFIKKSNVNQIMLCQDCLKQNHPYELARAFGPYRGIIKTIIYQFKYGGYRSLGNLLANLMIKIMQDDSRFGSIDMIIPVPISVNKLRKRRFNQSELLAKKIAKVLKIKLDCSNLIKIKDTISQSKLTKQMRQVNLIEAFSIKDYKKVMGKKILLVDDIYTTGSTVTECCRVLLAAGAQSIKVITIASGEVQNEGGKQNEFA